MLLRCCAFVLLACCGRHALADETTDTPAMRKLYEQAGLTSAGNREAGRKLFFDERRTQCSICHQVAGVGGSVGPELTQIGGKFDRPHLIESLLEPSKQIVEGFRTSILVTDDGTAHSGVVKSRSPDRIRLLNAKGESIELETTRIEAEKTSPVSLMPAGLASGLSVGEFTSLIAYLESLRSGPQKPGAGISGPIGLPEGFQVSTIATGLDGCVAIEASSDGRLFVAEQSGKVRVIRDGQLLPTPFVTLPTHMEWERGLIGLTLAPDFPKDPHVYVCYVRAEPYMHHVFSRWVAEGDCAVLGSEQVLFEGDDQSQLGGNVPAGHQGGGMHFGADGMLYIGLGEQTAGMPAQRLDSLLGKILRIAPDGSIPRDNPLIKQTTGKYQAIWALGLRNPFTFAFNRQSGEMLINDVGGEFEEINRGIAGQNYGWPIVEHGPSPDPRYTGPIHIYPQASISGGDFVPQHSNWPDPWPGKYLFADFVHGWIHAIDASLADPVANKPALDFAHGLRRPVDMRFGSDGHLYVLLRNAWVVDDKFQGGTGSVIRISYERD